MHPAALSVDQLLKDCVISTGRASGPGGQHRNKVETAVVVLHQPTGCIGQASERRSQAQNRQQAVFRLRLRLARDIRCAANPPPSELWKSRTRGRRISVSREHDDYPAVLAEALDFLQLFDGNIRSAAQNLGTSTTQLSRFFQREGLKVRVARRSDGIDAVKTEENLDD